MAGEEEGPGLAVIVVTHDSAAVVGETLARLQPQLGPRDEVVVVDNASRDGTATAVRAAAPWARLVEPGANTGFAGGCNRGAAASGAPLLLLLNPDAAPAPRCLAALRRAAAEHPDWGAWQALVTMPDGSTINTAGGVVHFLGLGWAGRCGEPVAAAPAEGRVGFASGAAMCIRREAWAALGGFDEAYFMYGEDLELSLRLRLAGWETGIAPGARVAHHYAFDKGARKWFLLERNRWWTLLTTYPRPLLVLLAPALLGLEAALLAIAARDGWLGAKLRAQAAVLRSLPSLPARRRRVQATRRIGAAAFAAALSAELDSPYLSVPRPAAVLQRAYWRAVRALLARSARS
jgi:GT2 family glycosyltransferase